jgi:hypothetical protein
MQAVTLATSGITSEQSRIASPEEKQVIMEAVARRTRLTGRIAALSGCAVGTTEGQTQQQQTCAGEVDGPHRYSLTLYEKG